jgi:hypothetical protein
VDAVVGLLVALAIYALQILFSIWRLHRVQFGPLEWLWWSLTHLQLQPLRLQAVPVGYKEGAMTLHDPIVLIIGKRQDRESDRDWSGEAPSTRRQVLRGALGKCGDAAHYEAPGSAAPPAAQHWHSGVPGADAYVIWSEELTRHAAVVCALARHALDVPGHEPPQLVQPA